MWVRTSPAGGTYQDSPFPRWADCLHGKNAVESSVVSVDEPGAFPFTILVVFRARRARYQESGCHLRSSFLLTEGAGVRVTSKQQKSV